VSRAKKTLAKVQAGFGTIAMRDLETVLIRLGFSLDRVSGSHHIYVHPKASRPLNIQRRGKDAKPYQVRQLRDMIEEFDLRLDDDI
jgi:predicted RNA binding protein YcfA (HicA-like mRNA interferase family)